MSPLPWPLTGNIFFFFYFFNYFYKLYIAIINHKQVLCLSKEEWFTYDTTAFLHLINHIQNQKKMQERKKWWTLTAHHGTSSHHLQIAFFPPLVAPICLDPCREERAVQSLRSTPARLCAALNRTSPEGSILPSWLQIVEEIPANRDFCTLPATACRSSLGVVQSEAKTFKWEQGVPASSSTAIVYSMM